MPGGFTVYLLVATRMRFLDRLRGYLSRRGEPASSSHSSPGICVTHSTCSAVGQSRFCPRLRSVRVTALINMATAGGIVAYRSRP